MLKPYLQLRSSSIDLEPILLEESIFKAMYELLEQIGVFWKNTPEGNNLKTDLYTFMKNRISIDPAYLEEYRNAVTVLEEFKREFATKEEAYAAFFQDKEGLQDPPQTHLAFARQKVSNEFIDFQLSMGGFKSFGAKNYPGYISGAYIEGKPAPYRT